MKTQGVGNPMTENALPAPLAGKKYTSVEVCQVIEKWVWEHYGEHKRVIGHDYLPIFAAALEHNDCFAWYTSLNYDQRKRVIDAYGYIVCDELLHLLPIVILLGLQKGMFVELSLVSMAKNWAFEQVKPVFVKLLAIKDNDVARAVGYVTAGLLAADTQDEFNAIVNMDVHEAVREKFDYGVNQWFYFDGFFLSPETRAKREARERQKRERNLEAFLKLDSDGE